MKAGYKVTYVPDHGNIQWGIIKEMHPTEKFAWVVYHCNDDWDDYENYTGQLTNLKNLKRGWITKT